MEESWCLLYLPSGGECYFNKFSGVMQFERPEDFRPFLKVNYNWLPLVRHVNLASKLYNRSSILSMNIPILISTFYIVSSRQGGLCVLFWTFSFNTWNPGWAMAWGIIIQTKAWWWYTQLVMHPEFFLFVLTSSMMSSHIWFVCVLRMMSLRTLLLTSLRLQTQTEMELSTTMTFML